MPKSYEEISKSIASQNGKTDANLANDSNHLGGIPASEYATKAWVQEYHGNKESILTDYINQQDAAMLNAAKEYTNSAIRNQDFSDFAETVDLQALNTNLTNKINTDIAAQKSYTDQKTQAIVDDVNANFEDVEDAIDQLNDNVNDLFQSVSDGKELIAEAITDKGVTTSATANFETMANNIEQIDTNQGVIVIPPGYIDTSDATAGPDQILQGYSAYSNGNKIHGTYVGSGSPGGGVILGEDEVVATKIYGESGVLTGQKLSHVDGEITLSQQNTYELNVFKPAIVTTSTAGTFAIIDRKYTENVDNEIAIYNITEQVYSHKNYNSKFSYTYSELGIQGNVLCIVASQLEFWTDIVQISVGTTVGIYSFLFDGKGNNGNGAIGATKPSSSSSAIWKNKIVINKPVSGYGAIAYSNTDKNTFAYHSNGKIYISCLNWYPDLDFDTIDFTEVQVETNNNNVDGFFRFSISDRFLTFAPWGNTDGPELGIMLLNDFRYIVHQKILEEKTENAWYSGQFAISPDDQLVIMNGKLYQLTYSIEDKSITYTQMSDAEIIPYNSTHRESLLACFSKDGNYVYAISSFNAVNEMVPLASYKVDLINLDSGWTAVSNQLAIGNPRVEPIIDVLNQKAFSYVTYAHEAGKPDMDKNTIGFYYYRADPNVKDMIGLSWNGNLYKKSWTI